MGVTVAHGKRKLLPFVKATLSTSQFCLISDCIPAFEVDIIARKARLSDVIVFAAITMEGRDAPIATPAAQKALFLRKDGGSLIFSEDEATNYSVRRWLDLPGLLGPIGAHLQ